MNNNDISPFQRYKLISELRRARNELCEKCEKYKCAHTGACDGCHWKDAWRETINK